MAATGGAVPDAVPRGQGETLLLVDNDSLGRVSLRLTLQYLGYQVLTALVPAAQAVNQSLGNCYGDHVG